MGVLAGMGHQYGFCVVSGSNSCMARIFLALVTSGKPQIHFFG